MATLRTLAVAVVASGLYAARPAAVLANNYSGASGNQANCAYLISGGTNMQDPNPHTFYYSNLSPHMANATNEARLNQLDRTSVDTSYPGTVSSLTDVVVYDQDYTSYCGMPWHYPGAPAGTTWAGSAICVSLASGNKCEKHEVRYDNSAVDDDPWHYQYSAACHEVGHTVGLMHRDDPDTGCIAQIINGHYHYSEHDVGHINGGPMTLRGDTFLFNGSSMFSWDGHYRVYMQPDGNLVLYNHWGGTALWSSRTNGWGNGVHAKIQSDGNFVVYVASAYGLAALCSTHTNGRGPSLITIQNDGNFVIYPNSGGTSWASGSGGQCW